MKRDCNLLVNIATLISIPILFLLVIIPTLIASNLEPQLNLQDYKENDYVLGIEQYRLGGLEVSVAKKASHEATFNFQENQLSLNFTFPKENKHYVLSNSLIISNPTTDTITIIMSPTMESFPSNTEFAVTMDSVTNYVIIDALRNVYPAQISVDPGNTVILGFRVDSLDVINYFFNFGYTLSVKTKE